MKELTPRQQEVFNFIKSYLIKHKYPPSVRDIAGYFKISVKASHDHIKALEKKGYIRCDGNRSRAIEIIMEDDTRDSSSQHIPLLGNVAAGKPLFSEENFDGTVEVPYAYLGSGNYFALRVQGDSMIDAGIHDGDIAVIRQQNIAENGEIVVAMLNDAVTLKKLYVEKTRIRLQPANKAYSTIYSRKAHILGKMALLLRTYG